MTVLQKGGNAPLSSKQLEVSLGLEGLSCDVAALGIRKDGKIHLSGGQEWMALFTQASTPEGALALRAADTFALNLDLVPPEVDKIVFVASLPEGAKGVVEGGHFHVASGGVRHASYAMQRVDLSGKETSLILGEVYRRGQEWKVRAVGQGYNDGFAALLKSYGVVIEDPPAPTPDFQSVAKPSGLSLQKKRLISLEKKAPALVGLATTAHLSLEKAGLGDLPALEVFAVLDSSLSMQELYNDKTVQAVAERLMAVAAILDDDGSVPLIRFDSSARMLAPIDLSNFSGHVNREIRGLGSDTRYATAMTLVAEHETDKWVDVGGKIKSAKTPRLVFFLTDGDNSDKPATEKLLQEAARTPTYYVFVGVGRGPFDFLNKLDTLPGCLLDNVTTLFYPDMSKIPDDKLYADIVKDLPKWLDGCRALGLLSDHSDRVAQDPATMARLEKALKNIDPPPSGPNRGSGGVKRFLGFN